MELEILPDYSEFTQIYESKIVRERGFTVFRQNILLLFSSFSIRLLSKQIFLPLPLGSAVQEQSTANNYERSSGLFLNFYFLFPLSGNFSSMYFIFTYLFCWPDMSGAILGFSDFLKQIRAEQDLSL